MVTGMGAFDLIVELMARDDEQLFDLIARIRAIDGVISTEVTSIVETVKWVYAPGFS